MITKAQQKKMNENSTLDDLVHDLKGKEASSINNGGTDSQIDFCRKSGMNDTQIVEACGMKPLKANRWLTDGLTKQTLVKQPTTHEQLTDMLTELLNSVETEGCDGCGTVGLEVVNKGRRLLGWSEL